MKRIVFTFDAQTLKSLDVLMQSGKFNSLAEAVRCAVNNMSHICENAKKDEDIVVSKTNNEGKKEKIKLRF